MAMQLSGSLLISGSLDANSFSQNGQPLTSDPFPYTGSAIISGSQQVSGSVGFSYEVSGAASWSAGGSLISAKQRGSGAGTQNAGLAFGGFGSYDVSEEYNGTSWATGGTMINVRICTSGAGTQNAGLAISGDPSAQSLTEEYNGSSWSAGGALSVSRYLGMALGTQNSALIAGTAPSAPNNACTEEYDGTSWSAGGALINGRQDGAGAGTQNAGLVFAGGNGPYMTSTNTEEYNGTAWSAGGALANAKYGLGGAGEQNSALAASGGPPSVGLCAEVYNGTSWSSTVALSVSRYGVTGVGSQSAAAVFGGAPSALSICTLEYTGASGGFVKSFDYSSTTGETTVSCLIETSAERYKDNIQPMGSQLSKVMQLQPVEFDWKSNRKHDIGFVADSVKNVYPNLVSEKDGQVEGMNYSKLVSALVKSIQEQQTQIDELKTRLDNNN